MDKQKLESSQQESDVQFSIQIDQELEQMKQKDFSMYLHLKSVLTKIAIYYDKQYTENDLKRIKQNFQDIFKKSDSTTEWDQQSKNLKEGDSKKQSESILENCNKKMKKNLRQIKQNIKDFFIKSSQKSESNEQRKNPEQRNIEKQSEWRLQKYNQKMKQLDQKQAKSQNKRQKENLKRELEIMEWLKSRLEFYNNDSWEKADWQDIDFEHVLNKLNKTTQDFKKIQPARFQQVMVKETGNPKPIKTQHQQTILFLTKEYIEINQQKTRQQIDKINSNGLDLKPGDKAYLYKAELTNSQKSPHLKYQIKNHHRYWGCTKTLDSRYIWHFNRLLEPDQMINLVKSIFFGRESQGISQDSNQYPSIVFNLPLYNLHITQPYEQSEPHNFWTDYYLLLQRNSIKLIKGKMKNGKRPTIEEEEELQQYGGQLTQRNLMVFQKMDKQKQVKSFSSFTYHFIKLMIELSNKLETQDNFSQNDKPLIQKQKGDFHKLSLKEKVFINLCKSPSDYDQSYQNADHIISFPLFYNYETKSTIKNTEFGMKQANNEDYQKLIDSLFKNENDKWLIDKTQASKLKPSRQITSNLKINDQVQVCLFDTPGDYYLTNMKNQLQGEQIQHRKKHKKGESSSNTTILSIKKLPTTSQGQSMYQLIKKKYISSQPGKYKTQQTPWLMYKTYDGRCFWAGKIKVDITDVQFLLRFLITRRHETDSLQNCPSIAISSGMHGSQEHKGLGLNHDDPKTIKQNLDKRLIWQAKRLVHDLSQQNKNQGKNTMNKSFDILINEQNVGSKIYISEFGTKMAELYIKTQADHIIDTRCAAGQLYKIDERYFFHNRQEEISEEDTNQPKVFRGSHKIQDRPIQKLLLKFLENQGEQIRAERLYPSNPVFQVQQARSIREIIAYYEKSGMRNILFMVSAFKYEDNDSKQIVLGGYSHQPHFAGSEKDPKSENQQGQNSNGNKYVPDPTKRSFLFSMKRIMLHKQYEVVRKYGLKDESKALMRSQNKNRFSFGQDEFVVEDIFSFQSQIHIQFNFNPNKAYEQEEAFEFDGSGESPGYKKVEDKSPQSQQYKMRTRLVELEIWLIKHGQNN